jgi:hypothetical protein
MYAGNQETKSELKDVLNGVQLALVKLVREKNTEEAKRILHIVDVKLVNLVNQMQVVRPS